MPTTAHDDPGFGGTVHRADTPADLDTIPAEARRLVGETLATAFATPADALAAAAKAVGLPGFAAWAERLAAQPTTLEVAEGSFAHDDDAHLVFGTMPATPPATPAASDEATSGLPGPSAFPAADGSGERAPAGLPPPPGGPVPPPLDFASVFDPDALDQMLPPGAVPDEARDQMRAEMQALGAKMQQAFAPRPAVAAPASAEAVALSFAPPPALDLPARLQTVYEAVGTIRLGPPGSTVGLVAPQPADYRLDAADPDYLAFFETPAGDLLATTEDGAAAVWLRAEDAGETPVPAGTLDAALDALFAALARGEVPAPPEAG